MTTPTPRRQYLVTSADIDCPKCDALRGDPCLYSDGVAAPPTWFHNARTQSVLELVRRTLPIEPEREFGVLFSHASTMVYEHLVADLVFATRTAAEDYGNSVARAQGVECEIMSRANPSAPWLSTNAETATHVIRRRWTA